MGTLHRENLFPMGFPCPWCRHATAHQAGPCTQHPWDAATTLLSAKPGKNLLKKRSRGRQEGDEAVFRRLEAHSLFSQVKQRLRGDTIAAYK